MKSLKKRLLSTGCFLLATSMLLVSCNNAPSGDTTGSKTPESNAESAEAPKIHKLKMLGKEDWQTATYVSWEDKKDFKSWQLWEEALKTRNIELEYELIVKEQYPTAIQTRMASGVDLPDIVNLTPLDDPTALSLGQSGTIIDINAAIDQYSDGSINKLYDGELSFAKKLTTAPDGKRYWFSTAIAGSDIKLANGKTTDLIDFMGSAIRKDWLDKLGLPIPKTIEEWVAALRLFREKDVNGSGVKDEILMFDPYSYSFFTGIAQWFGLVPDVAAYDPTTDKVVSPWYQEGIKDYFTLLNTLTKEGIFDVSMVGATDEACNQRIAEDKIASMRSYAVASWFEDLIKTNPDATYTLIPTLKAKEGVTPYSLCDAPDLSFDKFSITKNCQDVEGAIKLFDLVFSEEHYLMSEFGAEGNYKTDENGRIDWSDELKVKTPEERYIARESHAGMFISMVLPRIVWPHGALTDATYLAKQRDDKAKGEAQVQLDTLEYRPYITSPFSSTKYAIATPEELEITNKYYTALKSYSEELAMNLILGNEKIADWDKHIKKLQDNGLDEIIKVNQARYARYAAAK